MFASSVGKDEPDFVPTKERQFKRDVMLETNPSAIRTGSTENLIEFQKRTDAQQSLSSTKNSSFYSKNPFTLSLSTQNISRLQSKWMQHFTKNSFQLLVPIQHDFGFYGGIPLQVVRKKSSIRSLVKRTFSSTQRTLGQTFLLTDEGYIASLDDPSYVLDAQESRQGTSVVIRKRDVLRGYTWTEQSQRWMIKKANVDFSDISTSTAVQEETNSITIHPLANLDCMLAIEIPVTQNNTTDSIQFQILDSYPVTLVSNSSAISNGTILSDDKQFAYIFTWDLQFQS